MVRRSSAGLGAALGGRVAELGARKDVTVEPRRGIGVSEARDRLGDDEVRQQELARRHRRPAPAGAGRRSWSRRAVRVRRVRRAPRCRAGPHRRPGAAGGAVAFPPAPARRCRRRGRRRRRPRRRARPAVWSSGWAAMVMSRVMSRDATDAAGSPRIATSENVSGRRLPAVPASVRCTGGSVGVPRVAWQSRCRPYADSRSTR